MELNIEKDQEYWDLCSKVYEGKVPFNLVSEEEQHRMKWEFYYRCINIIKKTNCIHSISMKHYSHLRFFEKELRKARYAKNKKSIAF